MDLDISLVQLDDLIMIPQGVNAYMFLEIAGIRTPVFKVKNIDVTGGDYDLTLRPMEILFPEPLYRILSGNEKILKAILDKYATAKELDQVTDFTQLITSGTLVTSPEISEVSSVATWEIAEHVDRVNRCPNPTFGTIKVTNPPVNLEVIVTHKPHNGVIEFEPTPFQWTYLCWVGKSRNDHFEITIWDADSGVWATQVVHIWDHCQKPKTLDVNITNEVINVELEGPIDTIIRPIPLTTEVIPVTVLKEPITVKASNYQRILTPITEAVDVRLYNTYTYLIQIEDLYDLDHVSFIAVEELGYDLDGETLSWTYTDNQSPGHLLPFSGLIRLQNLTPDPDSVGSRISIMARIEDLKYRDNASYQQPTLVAHDMELEIEIIATVKLLAKTEDIPEEEETPTPSP